MKTREFNINNYKLEDIIKDIVRTEAEKFIATFNHEFLLPDSKVPLRVETYYSKFVSYADMTKAQQKRVEKLAKELYEENKKKTIADWKALKEKCDTVFHDDKQYAKLLPELTNLYYCQAHTALLDFYNKKIQSKSVSNAKYQARAMRYSKISCD